MKQDVVAGVVDQLYRDIDEAWKIDTVVDIAARAVQLCAKIEELDEALPARPALHVRELRRAAERVANITSPMDFNARRQLMEDAISVHGLQLAAELQAVWATTYEEEDVS